MVLVTLSSKDGAMSQRALIIIPTYNEIENLPRLIDEVEALHPDIHFLVVDDGSPMNWRMG